MKKNILLVSAFFGLALICPACTTIRELPRAQVSQEGNTMEHKICRELLMCFLKDDASGFISRLSPESAQNFDAATFKKTREAVVASLGEPVSFRYLTTLEFVSFMPHIWVVRFRRTTLDKKGEFYSEAMFRIITGRSTTGEILVISFNFL